MLFDSQKKYILYDGAMGTMLQKAGLMPGEKPDLMNITAPQIVESIHRMYVEVGSDIICTNTFGANALNLKDTGYTPEKVITAAVEIAQRASAGRAKVALDIGSIGYLLEPNGDFEPEDAYAIFRDMAVAGEKAGADFVAIETMSDLGELKEAMTAVRDNTKLPMLVTMTFEKGGRTFMDATVEGFAELAEELGAAAIGLNCSLEPPAMLETAKLFSANTSLPIIIKPNAGLPDGESGEYHTGAELFAKQMVPFAEMGAKILGGCCGTTPEYIEALKNELDKMVPFTVSS